MPTAGWMSLTSESPIIKASPAGAARRLETSIEHGQVGLAEANVKRGYDRVNQVGHIQVVEVTPVLRRAAYLHVAEHDAPQAEAVNVFEEFACAWKECDAGNSRGAQRATCRVDTVVCAVQAKRLECAAENSPCVLDR